MRRTLLATLIVIAALLSLVVAAPAEASATHHSVATTLKWTTGKTYGPNPYTDWGKATIKSWTQVTDCHTHVSHWTPDIGVKQYPNPLLEQARPRLAGPRALSAPAACPSGVYPDSWYNPASWHWSKILGTAWDKIVSHCLTGSAQGVVGVAGGTLIVKLIFRGARVAIGPEGYAVLAIGGCIVGMIWQI